VLADKALVSFLRIITEIAASDEVKKYARHPKILEAFGTDEDGFEVALGFGLHCGWAIEGPIGSRYKIDASYLSPHVNLSETLQDATKIYGTPLLVSGEFYSLLSPYVKCYCRRVDVVKVSGREAPINLYTFDIHPRALAAIIEGHSIPEGYDVNDTIAVVELRGKNAILADTQPTASSNNAACRTRGLQAGSPLLSCSSRPSAMPWVKDSQAVLLQQVQHHEAHPTPAMAPTLLLLHPDKAMVEQAVMATPLQSRSTPLSRQS